MELGPPDIAKSAVYSVFPESQVLTGTFAKLFGKKTPIISSKSYPKFHQNNRTPRRIGTIWMCNVMAGFREIKIQVILIDFVQHSPFTVSG